MENLSKVESMVPLLVASLVVINIMVGVNSVPTSSSGPSSKDVQIARALYNHEALDSLVANLDMTTGDVADINIVSVNVLGGK